MYEPAIRQVLGEDLQQYISELTGVYDENLLLYEHKERLTAPSSGSLSYPFVSLLFQSLESEGPNPPPVKRSSVVTSESPTFDSDVLEEALFPERLLVRVTLYTRSGQWNDAYRLRGKLLNYFRIMADERLSPSTGSVGGLNWAWVDPVTGMLDANQDNPSQSSVPLECLVTSVGRASNETTVLNVALDEVRWAFPVTIAALGVAQLRWPTIEHVTISGSIDQEGEPESTHGSVPLEVLWTP